MPATSLLIAVGLVRALGAVDYGLVVIALAVSGLSAAVNPVIAASTTKFVSEAVGGATDVGAQVARVVAASLAAVLAIDVLLTLVALIFGKPLSTLIFGQDVASHRRDISLILLLAVLSICLQQIEGVFSAALRGLELFRRQAILEMCSRAVLTVVVIATAWATRKVLLVLAVYSLFFIASSLVRAAAVAMSLQGGILLRRPRKLDFQRMVGFAGWMWLNALATVAYGSVDRIVVGRVVGAAAAAQFSIYVQISQLVHLIPASLFAFLYPVFSRLMAERTMNQSSILSLFRSSFLASILIGAAIATIIVCFRGSLLRVVGGNVFTHAHAAVLFVLVAGYLILVVNIVPYCLLLGSGATREVSLITGGSMLAAIAMTTVLIPAFGEQGAAVARLVYGLGTLSLVLRSRRFLVTRE